MGTRLGMSVVAMALLLAACGTSTTDRAASGAGIGAAAGAIGGAFFGAPLIGAAVGAAAGGTVGAVTTPSDVDLGKPVWK
ncbi:MAG TPA: glycine zipper family protein [Stellaceae bacterium]|nr:glycine zipper family protein [Stellaceae bacterium]